MQLIPNEDLLRYELSNEQRLFVEALYQMVHLESMDSHRAKCLNLRTVICEMHRELQIGRLEEDEFKAFCKECLEFLQSDPLGEPDFPLHYAELLPFLKSPTLKPKKIDKPEDLQKKRTFEAFGHAVADFAVELERDYLGRLCGELPKALAVKDSVRIVRLTGAILSDLIYRGYSYSALYGWYKKFLTNPADHDFASNLDFMLRLFKQKPTAFRVTLQFSGTTKLSRMGQQGRFTFTDTVAVRSEYDESKKRFYKTNKQRAFATGQIDAPDHESAAVQARAEVEAFLDLLRLEYERNPVAINETVHAVRLSDDTDYLIKVQTTLPNPVEEVSHEDFVDFAAQVQRVTSNQEIDRGTKEQVRAAIRQYRIGRDAVRPHDKCLHWWMGLESLTHIGGGHIGETVGQNASRVLVNGYLLRHVRDLLVTLKHCGIGWTDDLKKQSGADGLAELTIPRLITILQDAGARPKLWDQCSDHPLIAYHGERLGFSLESPTKAADLLQRHLDHLEWQIARLYRIRCCLVHGSEVRHPLPPYAANLEYYLKQLIDFVIKALTSHQHIHSRQELFLRASLTHDRKMQLLRANGATKDAVIRAVFEDIVVRTT